MTRSIEQGWRSVSRRTLAGVCCVALVLAVAAALLGPRAAAARGAGAGDDPGPAVGTWNQVVHVPGSGDHQTMVTFHADGTMSALAAEGPVPCPAGTPPCTFHELGLGVWSRTGPRTFTYTFKEFIYDSGGNHVGYVVPHNDVTISADGNSCTESGTTGVWTVAGTVPVFAAPVTADGTRMTFPPS